MVAKAIAENLNLELYKIDLLAMINQYMGETEKNVCFIFSDIFSGLQLTLNWRCEH